jgi:hypothetical protein
VCDQLCNKILKCEIFKKDKYFVDEVETLIKRKITLGQPNPGNPLFKRQSQLQSIRTHIPMMQ